MRKIIQITQVVPIILITSYVGFFFFTDFQLYADLHYRYLESTDNILVVLSLLAFAVGGYKSWNKLAIRSFWTMTLLNIITELNIDNYYSTYSLIVQFFLLTLILTQIPIKQKWT